LRTRASGGSLEEEEEVDEDEDDDEAALELVEEDEDLAGPSERLPVGELDRLFGIEEHILFDTAIKGTPEPGRVGLPRAVLHHSDGTALEVFMHGANATSWVLPNGGDVLYALPSSPFDGIAPIEGGIPIAFPQVGKGGEFPGAAPAADRESIPENGFARHLEWRIVDTVRYGVQVPDIKRLWKESPAHLFSSLVTTAGLETRHKWTERAALDSRSK